VPLRRAKPVPQAPSDQDSGQLIKFPGSTRPADRRPAGRDRHSILGHHPDCPVPYQRDAIFCSTCQGIRKGQR